ncbi:MAG: DUF3109 family protein [Candidatus Wallbacteria bacterium]|nr:DUF3109 family protein [Candidatus Wallbacteria bacterium]
MIKVGKVLVSEEAVAARFACDLGACLGACCRVGDLGAPLAAGEREAIREALPRLLPGLPAENRERISASGWVDSRDDGKEQLACFPDGRCVFSVPLPVAARPGAEVPLGCALEAAFRSGATGFPKPIFCHLFPLKLACFYDQTAVNAERRPECEAGFDAGCAAQTGLLEFSRDALVRLFGQKWYDALLPAARAERERLAAPPGRST